MGARWTYIRKWNKWHKTYEKVAYNEVMAVFRAWVKKIPWDQLNEDNYKPVISNTFDLGMLNKAYYNIYLKIGLIHGQRVGEGINTNLKGFVFSLFSTWFERMMIVFLGKYGAKRIVTVHKRFFEYIVDIISTRIEKEKDFVALSEDINRLVNRSDFYEWQGLRIARTEATAAANYAATQAGAISGFVMVKEWIATGDDRTRRNPEDKWDHLEMSGRRVLLNEKFRMESEDGFGEGLDYPGDPSGSAANVINCRCTVAVIPARDKNGNLIPTF